MAKSRREDPAEEKGDGYEFKMPAFDEPAFIRREVQGAKASFYTVGLGFLAGILSTALALVAPWPWGWLPLVGSMAALRPLLQKLGFGEDVTSWKALVGSFFMLFFTGLAVWLLGVNVIG